MNRRQNNCMTCRPDSEKLCHPEDLNSYQNDIIAHSKEVVLPPRHRCQTVKSIKKGRAKTKSLPIHLNEETTAHKLQGIQKRTDFL